MCPHGYHHSGYICVCVCVCVCVRVCVCVCVCVFVPQIEVVNFQVSVMVQIAEATDVAAWRQWPIRHTSCK